MGEQAQPKPLRHRKALEPLVLLGVRMMLSVAIPLIRDKTNMVLNRVLNKVQLTT